MHELSIRNVATAIWGVALIAAVAGLMFHSGEIPTDGYFPYGFCQYLLVAAIVLMPVPVALALRHDHGPTYRRGGKSVHTKVEPMSAPMKDLIGKLFIIDLLLAWVVMGFLDATGTDRMLMLFIRFSAILLATTIVLIVTSASHLHESERTRDDPIY